PSNVTTRRPPPPAVTTTPLSMRPRSSSPRPSTPTTTPSSTPTRSPRRRSSTTMTTTMTTRTTTSTISTTSTTRTTNTTTRTTRTRTTETTPAAESPPGRGPPRHLHVLFTTAPLRGAGSTPGAVYSVRGLRSMPRSCLIPSRPRRAHVVHRGGRPGPGPGPDRVPPGLLERARARGGRADGSGTGPGRGVHRDHPARHRDRGADLLLGRHQPHHRQVVPRPGREDPALRPGRADGLAGDRRLPPDRRAGTAVRGADRLQPAEPLHHLGDADPLRPPAGARRPDRAAPQGAHPAQRARRHPVRLRPGTRPHPGRLPLRRHDHRGTPHGLQARGRRPLRLPAGGAGGVRLRPVQGRQGGARAADGRRTGGGRSGGGALPDGDRGLDRGGLRSGLCRDRLVHADHREPLVPDVRHLPRRRGPGAAGPALVRCDRSAGRGLSRPRSADRMIDGCIPGPHLPLSPFPPPASR